MSGAAHQNAHQAIPLGWIAIRKPLWKNVPVRTRTSNLWLRRPTLYPIELQGL